VVGLGLIVCVRTMGDARTGELRESNNKLWRMGLGLGVCV
jgi:hypothetical protein